VRFDFNPGFMRAAREFGLGELDLSSIELEGELQELPGFSLPPLGGEALLENTDIQGMISGKTSLIPRADPELCTGCETCVEQCPVSALSMEGGLPVVDGEACITCFCCQEICPEKAVTLR
jgi:ferredoxin